MQSPSYDKRYCVDCAHHCFLRKDHRCFRDVIAPTVNLVTGESSAQKHEPLLCIHERELAHRCGPLGVFWKPKKKPKAP